MSTKPKVGERVFFTEGDQALPIPDLIAHQKDSWEDFVKNGLREIFTELNPIDDYTGQKLSLRFKDYYFKEPKETEYEAKYNLATYEAPLHVLVELENKQNGTKKEQDIYFGDYPWMTDRATFIINGTERVIVSQLIRSAGASNATMALRLSLVVVPGSNSRLPRTTLSTLRSTAAARCQ